MISFLSIRRMDRFIAFYADNRSALNEQCIGLALPQCVLPSSVAIVGADAAAFLWTDINGKMGCNILPSIATDAFVRGHAAFDYGSSNFPRWKQSPKDNYCNGSHQN